jgi:hypothetical protein
MTMHKRWHKHGEWENKEVMVQLFGVDAWKALENFDPELAKYMRNVCIGLAIDGFTPFCENVTSYSCWSV